MPLVSLKQVIGYILAQPALFPGRQSQTQPRSIPGLPALDAQRQLQTIWTAMTHAVRARLERGQGVHIEGLGSFALEPQTAPLGNSKNPRSAVLALDVAFVRSSRKGRTYDEGVRMGVLNRAVIAKQASYAQEVVNDAIHALVKAINDLVTKEFTVELDWGFGRVSLSRSSVKAVFSGELKAKVAGIAQQWPTVSVTSEAVGSHGSPVSAVWKTEQVLSFAPRHGDEVEHAKALTKVLILAATDLNSTN
jgi:nucleoid DNA-binding protein